jgi:hypothetical protein
MKQDSELIVAAVGTRGDSPRELVASFWLKDQRIEPWPDTVSSQADQFRRWLVETQDKAYAFDLLVLAWREGPDAFGKKLRELIAMTAPPRRPGSD